MKIICITGGVLSGIGKGISGASIGTLLKSCGYAIFMQKFDGYLNIDAGTINPYKHGECFVTADGAETDLDIGHYERFIDTDMSSHSSYTMGKLYQEILTKERDGDYLGNDVQMIPHMTSLIKEKITEGYNNSKADISIVEIGGTVGDIENEVIVEAVRQLRDEYGKDNVVFTHVTYIPYLMSSKELKTKPTQNSVKDLRARGIIPDILLLRADYQIPEPIRQKVSTMCGVPFHMTLPMPTLSSIYLVPEHLQSFNMSHLLLALLDLKDHAPQLKKRKEFTSKISQERPELSIAIVGKYVDFEDAYYSLNEALKVAGWHINSKVILHFLEAEHLHPDTIHEQLKNCNGICIPGGFGTRGMEGMILATQYTRMHNIPFLGICLGSHIMAIEFARNVLQYKDATSEEFDPHKQSNHHIIHSMEEQKNLTRKGGTMRLGNYPCVLKTGSKIAKLFPGESKTIQERHRHRFEFNNLYREQFEAAGCSISGTSPDGSMVEMIELIDHPFMCATQSHPELLSRPTNPHPLILGFVSASRNNQ